MKIEDDLNCQHHTPTEVAEILRKNSTSESCEKLAEWLEELDKRRIAMYNAQVALNIENEVTMSVKIKL